MNDRFTSECCLWTKLDDLDSYAVGALGKTGDDDNIGGKKSDESESEVAGTNLSILFLIARDSGCTCILRGCLARF